MSEMKETMNAELQEMIRTLEKANNALSRIFNVEEGETVQERADRTNPYLLNTKKEGEDDSISWGELAELTHATQVERFGWCGCEDQGTLVYMDCPKREGESNE